MTAYGVDHRGHVVVGRGDHVVDLSCLSHLEVGPAVWTSGSLNAFFALGPDAWARTHAQLRDLEPPSSALRAAADTELVMPFEVADYVDFYASEAHATNLGRILRPGSDPLPAAWKHLPIAYHGRAGTVVVSGADIPRPYGLRGPGDYGPSRRLDVEVELGFVVGQGSPRGRPVPTSQAIGHIFGVVVVNDWSARDIQSFEYVPLGPMLGKSFATSISPWVVPLSELEPFRTPGPPQDPPPAPYLEVAEPRGYALHFELAVNGTPISCVSCADLYWSVAQQVAHLTVNGASLRPGDLLATGTISNVGPARQGSLIELTHNGENPLVLAGGSTRTWLEDGDEVTIRGWSADRSLPLGEVRGRIVA